MIYYNTSTGLLIKKTEFDDGSSNHVIIPFDPDNTDYQAYLKWVEEGNEPLPAEE